ncbi:FAD-dependent oxidoreductase [Paraburkholderia oxyphila]|uniref:FAD-dependent oxidoreductase n=1 Tax=Paraburkholderia oxyphila TaxID=614212 RepID=UPI0005B79280|nr:FAD-dependent oxidoreductase [Paraburkholderia oxyphila]
MHTGGEHSRSGEPERDAESARGTSQPSGRYATDDEAPFSPLETRTDQAHPRLADEEIERARRFGDEVRWQAGETIYKAGQFSTGVLVLLRGIAQVTRHEGLGPNNVTTIRQGPGHFLGEAAQLSGRPSLVDAHALTDVVAVQLAPEQLRALIVAEAELGERVLRALVLRRAGLIEQGCGPVLVGRPGEARLVALEGFLRRNDHPHTVIDAHSDPDAVALLERIAPSADDLPVVVCPDGTVLRAPTENRLAATLGWLPSFERARDYDVVIVGAGPAGLAAAVYAASEGLTVAVFDARAPGGQAGASARIENFLGFPMGISGQALAGRAFVQAQKFGAHLFIPCRVSSLRCADEVVSLELEGGHRVSARTVVVASGASYRRPAIDGLAGFEGRGVYYWASPIEAKLCAGQDVVLVGGGNSAGQAAAYLATHARRVHVLVRGAGLEATMSQYLIKRLAASPNIEVWARTRVERLEGEEYGLTAVHCMSPQGPCSIRTRHLFLFTGADANTQWLRGCDVALDDKGFVLTGQGDPGHPQSAVLSLETSLPRVFAIGDVRSSSIKRVAAAVGEGAAVVAQIHSVLSEASAWYPPKASGIAGRED